MCTARKYCCFSAIGTLTINSILFKVWAQGLDGWRLLQQVSQLKWTLLAKGTAVMNESEMSALILSMLTHVCQFYPSKGKNSLTF